MDNGRWNPMGLSDGTETQRVEPEPLLFAHDEYSVVRKSARPEPAPLLFAHDDTSAVRS